MTKACIFLSHATPEDNDFTLWLASKLTLAGLDVWYDLDRLKGGDYQWGKIEAAIRNESIRLIAIVSNNSTAKDGVKNEWELATTIEKKVPGFIIPIRIDDFEFDKLPILIHRKNVIDFGKGWHHGLERLLDTLETQGISRRNASNTSVAEALILPYPTKSDIALIAQEEILESNWLPIIDLPPAIETTKILDSCRRIEPTNITRKIPWFEHGEHIIGFAKGSDLVRLFQKSTPLEAITSYDIQSFLDDGIPWNLKPISPNDARRRVNFLVRQAIHIFLEEKGLRSYEISNHQLVWYVPYGLLQNNKCEFTELSGKKRKKQLAGRSDKYKVLWHYGVSINPSLFPIQRIQLNAHIIFTDLEGIPVSSKKRMHQLRRSFCKNWWNDRWRGFNQALIAFLSDHEGNLSIPVGSERFLKIGSNPIEFTSPVSLNDCAEPLVDDLILLEPCNEAGGLLVDEIPLLEDGSDL